MVGADKLGLLGARERNRTASGFLTPLRPAGGIWELEEERREDTTRHTVVFLVVPPRALGGDEQAALRRRRAVS
jgi:hypothetical protein